MEPTLLCDGLSISANPPPQAVQKELYDAVVLMAEEHQPASKEFGDGVEVLRYPIDDESSVPTILEIRTAEGAALEVARRVATGQRVLVSCAAGMNRSAWVAGMALVELGVARTGSEAVELLVEKRGPSVFDGDQNYATFLRRYFRSQVIYSQR